MPVSDWKVSSATKSWFHAMLPYPRVPKTLAGVLVSPQGSNVAKAPTVTGQ